MNPLTAKQRQVLDIITVSLRDRGKAPTVREIAKQIGVKSTCTVQRHIEALIKKEAVVREKYQYRALRLKTTGKRCPWCGREDAEVEDNRNRLWCRPCVATALGGVEGHL